MLKNSTFIKETLNMDYIVYIKLTTAIYKLEMILRDLRGLERIVIYINE